MKFFVNFKIAPYNNKSIYYNPNILKHFIYNLIFILVNNINFDIWSI